MAIEFFFDVVCPFAYLASTRVEAIAAEAGEAVVWRPVLLGGVLVSNGVPPYPMEAMAAPRLRLTHLDMGRQAHGLGEPLAIPASHPRRTVEAMRLLVACAPDRVPALARALFRAYWVDGLDVADRSTLARLAAPFGVDAGRVLDDPAAKAALREATDAAVAGGVFGVPTFRVGDRTIWGVDRLHFLREALGLPVDRSPPPPAAGGALELFHDFASPFSYLGHTQARRVAAEAGAALVETPILLGALFRAIGTPMVPLFTYAPARQAWQRRDMEEWAGWWGVPFRFPSTFPLRTVLPLRVAVHAPDAAAPIYRAAWGDDRDVGDPDVLRGVLDDAGLDGPALLAAAEDPAVKARLRANTERAELLGACGVPTWRVGDALFWGQDRIGQVEVALRGGYGGTVD